MKTSTILTLGALGVGAYFLFTSMQKNGSTDGATTGGSSSVPINPYGVTATKTTEENLASANAYLGQPNAFDYSVADKVIKAKTSPTTPGRATTYTYSGKTITIGPTGNVYSTDPVTGKGTYSPGPNTKVLGATFVSSTSAKKEAAKTKIASDVKKALSGPKVKRTYHAL